MSSDKRYVLMLDTQRDFVRLFRADCPMRPDGKVLWEGNGLRNAYDAMKRLNKERARTIVYFLCTRKTVKQENAFRVAKSSVSEPWKKVSIHNTYKSCVETCKQARMAERERRVSLRLQNAVARQEEKKRRRESESALLKMLNTVGVRTKRVPKLTEKDRRYLEWIEQKRKLFNDAA